MITVKQIKAIQSATGQRKQDLLAKFLLENERLADDNAIRFCAQWRLDYMLEDMKQAARVAMIKAIGSFKVRKTGKPGAAKKYSAKTWNCAAYFANWFWFVCRDELQRCARAGGDDVHPQDIKARKLPRVRYVDIQDSYSGSASMAAASIQAPNGFAAILGASGNQELITAIDELPPVERKVVEALANGDTPNQIAKAYGIEDVHGFIDTIRRKLT